jgi:hypothetical protein
MDLIKQDDTTERAVHVAYAQRRACMLGELVACELEFRLGVEFAEEACGAVGGFCARGDNERACELARLHCPAESPRE